MDCNHPCSCYACEPSCLNDACFRVSLNRQLTGEINREAEMTSKDPNSYIQASAEQLAETLLSKNQDYAPTGEFSNFEKAAEVAGISALHVMAAQAAIKMTRIQSLMRGPQSFESLVDSFLDLAGYAIIAHAYLSAHDVVEGKPEKSYDQWNPAG